MALNWLDSKQFPERNEKLVIMGSGNQVIWTQIICSHNWKIRGKSRDSSRCPQEYFPLLSHRFTLLFSTRLLSLELIYMGVFPLMGEMAANSPRITFSQHCIHISNLVRELWLALLGSHDDPWTNHYHPGNSCHDRSDLDAMPIAVITGDW